MPESDCHQAWSTPVRRILCQDRATCGKLFKLVIPSHPRPTMTINIELQPEEERALLKRARVNGGDLAGYVQRILQEHLRTPEPDLGQDQAADGAPPSWEDLIDDEAIASCENQVDDAISPEDVRAATSKIKDSPARVVIEEERADRS
jgi:hypothetical protein